MMCTAAPSALPAGLDGRAALSMCGYADDYDDVAEMDALLGDIDLVVHAHPTTTTGLTPDPFALPMAPSAEFVAPPRRHDSYLDVLLRSIRSVKVASAPVSVAREDGPTTPIAELEAPFSYGDDDATVCEDVRTIKTASSKKRPVADPSEAYDGEIDATFRNMEKDPAERPSADYLWTTQEGNMTMLDRAELVTWMYEFSRFGRFQLLPPGALHRAVSYVDRFLSAKKFDFDAQDLRLLGAVAAFAASKYDDRRTSWLLINADTIARDVGCTRREVIDAERDLVAALGYRLSGPTAYTFVDHFTRRDKLDTDEGVMVRSLAHHLASMTLLDYRCVPLMPSAVAAAAILVARRVVFNSAATLPQKELWSEEMVEMTGYAAEDLADITDTIYEMHELVGVWPGCAQMMENFMYGYSLPPR
ncbi:hypothetical protein EJB05_21203, partial [Eragrostis curvula]